MNLHLPHSSRRRDPKLIVGLFALAIANSIHYFLPRLGLGTTSDGFDFIQGSLMGIAIALLIWSIATNARKRSTCD